MSWRPGVVHVRDHQQRVAALTQHRNRWFWQTVFARLSKFVATRDVSSSAR